MVKWLPGMRIGRIRRSALLALSLGASLFVLASGGSLAATAEAPADQYWLGPDFAGLPLTHQPKAGSGVQTEAFAYGDCEPPEGEGGCSVPAQVQNWSSCERNPIGLDRLPMAVYPVRGGGIAAQYESTAVDIGTGDRTAVVFADEELIGAALREVRLLNDVEPQPLAPPVYPMPVLRELKRATVAVRRFGGVRAAVRTTGLTPGEVRVRLQIAELLGPEALADVPPPTMSVATVERLRQLAFRAQYRPARAAREMGIPLATLKAKLRRVRGLTGYC